MLIKLVFCKSYLHRYIDGWGLWDIHEPYSFDKKLFGTPDEVWISFEELVKGISPSIVACNHYERKTINANQN